MPTVQLSTFGDLLKRRRLVANLTQEALAERAHLSARAISDLERGIKRQPQRQTVQLLADALGLVGAELTSFEAAARRLDARSLLPVPAGSQIVTAATSRQPVRPRRWVPPLVGRKKELAVLEHHLALDDVSALPPVLLLAGDPGIGKTRLLQETADRATSLGWTVLQGGCDRSGGQDPFAPLVQALEQQVHAAAPATLKALLHGCSWLVRLLPELAEGPIEPLPAWTLTSEQEHRLVVKAVACFLANVAGPAGTLLVLDDLQWAGRDALSLLTALLRSENDVPLRVVGAYRDTEVQPGDPLSIMAADLAHAGLVYQRMLHPLATTEATELFTRLLEQEGRRGPQALTARDLILRAASGVPFYLVSWAQGLRQDAAEEGEGVPWTVAQGLRQRVAALPADAQEVLGVAAIIGRTVSRTLVTTVATRTERDVLAALEAICHARLLEETDDHAYRFPHDVIREVMESDLGAARRTLLHRQIAEALQRLAGEPAVEEIAYHYAYTQEHVAAARWLERAGDHAAAAFANAAAVAHYRSARERVAQAAAPLDMAALSRLDEKLGDLHALLGEYALAQEEFARARAGETTPTRRVELWCKEGITCDRRGENSQALAAFATAEMEAADNGDHTAIATSARVALEIGRGRVYYRQSALQAAQAAAERAILLLGADDTGGRASQGMAQADLLLGNVAYSRGDLATAEQAYRQALAIYERVGDQSGLAWCWTNLGSVAVDRGDIEKAEDHYRRGLAYHERIGNQSGVAMAWNNLGEAAFRRGDLATVEECYRHSLAIYERGGEQYGIAGCQSNLGAIACERGDLTRAVTWCRTARRKAHAISTVDVEVNAVLWHACALFRGDEPSRPRLRAASRLLRHAHDLATAHGLTQFAVQAMLFMAERDLREACLEGSSISSAASTADEALHMAHAAELRTEESQAERLLGQCALARRAPGEAESHLRASLALLAGMESELEVARTQMALAEALVQGADIDSIPDEARTLLAEAHATLARSGATLDLARADSLLRSWRIA